MTPADHINIGEDRQRQNKNDEADGDGEPILADRADSRSPSTMVAPTPCRNERGMANGLPPP